MKIRLSLLLLFISLSLLACDNKKQDPTSAEQTNPQPKNIDTEAAQKLIAENKNIVILDVRTPSETSQGIIPGATIIDINNPDFDKLVANLDKSKPTLVYCKAGGRSARAADKMSKMGFKELYNLTSGYDGWK